MSMVPKRSVVNKIIKLLKPNRAFLGPFSKMWRNHPQATGISSERCTAMFIENTRSDFILSLQAFT